MDTHTTFNQSYSPLHRFFILPFVMICILISSVIGGIPLWIMGLIKVLTHKPWADKAVINIANCWISINNMLIKKLLPINNWQINLPANLSVHKQYLLVSNHQSWVDTTLVQYISQNTLPLTRFFTKYELIFIPFVGQAFYFLDFPMMKRHSKTAISKNPKLKNSDINEARRACQQIKDKPFTLLNFVEGSRFTSTKQQKQASPYQHLLKPKAGGLSLAINALGDEIDDILDITIVYPDGIPTFFDFWSGKVKNVVIEVQHLEIPETLFAQIRSGRYDRDAVVKEQMYDWLNDTWQKKDLQIQQIIEKSNNSIKK